jgi:hypothetical protein
LIHQFLNITEKENEFEREILKVFINPVPHHSQEVQHILALQMKRRHKV